MGEDLHGTDRERDRKGKNDVRQTLFLSDGVGVGIKLKLFTKNFRLSV